MKRYFTVIALALMFQNIEAQDISKLTVPTSPAFSILNYEPSAVMRPTNVKALAGDVLNSFDEGGKLLMNLGLEVAPYWLKSHPNLTRESYLRPNTGQTFLQSLSFSAATVKDSVSGNNKLGAGFRFKLFNGEPVEELTTASADLKTRTTVVSIINGVQAIVGTEIDTRQKAIDVIVNALNKKSINSTIVSEFSKDANRLKDDYTDFTSDIKDFLTQLIQLRVEAYGELAKKVSDLLYQRKGFILEFAGATGYNTSKDGLEKIGAWGNLSYYVSPDDLFSLTARYMNQNSDAIIDSALNNFDVGVGYLKKTSTYNISVEGMFRWYRAEIPDKNNSNQSITRLEKDFTYRLAVQGSYMITKDISINLSLGKDFNSPFVAGSGYFSILGLNYSIFSKKPLELQ